MTDGENEDEKKELGLEPCVHNWIVIYSLANILNNPGVIRWRVYLSMTCCLTTMMLLIAFRREQRIINNLCDIALCTPADYSIVVKNIPIGENCDYK